MYDICSTAIASLQSGLHATGKHASKNLRDLRANVERRGYYARDERCPA